MLMNVRFEKERFGKVLLLVWNVYLTGNGGPLPCQAPLFPELRYETQIDGEKIFFINMIKVVIYFF
jgi:hypothetical protein